MKIVPSGLIDSITQTSGGTTIQNSYGGLQLHKKAYQRKRKTVPQQTTRAVFANVQSSWGTLTPENQGTWNAAADPGTSGFQLYSATNNRLVGQGIPIISEYTSPVTPPVNDLEFEGSLYNFFPPDMFYIGGLESPGGEIPTSGWLPYVKWTGWTRTSQARYGPANFIVPQEAFFAFTAIDYAFQINASMNKSFRNFSEGCKAQFIIGIINTTTGQIFEYLTYEAIADL